MNEKSIKALLTRLIDQLQLPPAIAAAVLNRIFAAIVTNADTQ